MAALLFLTGCAPTISKDWFLEPTSENPCRMISDLADGREVVLFLRDGTEIEGVYEGCDTAGLRVATHEGEDPETIPWPEIERVARKANQWERGGVRGAVFVVGGLFLVGTALAILIWSNGGGSGPLIGK